MCLQEAEVSCSTVLRGAQAAQGEGQGPRLARQVAKIAEQAKESPVEGYRCGGNICVKNVYE